MAIATVSDVKLYLGIPSDVTTDDTLLTSLLSASETYIKRAIGQTIEPVETTRYYGRSAIDGKYLYLDDFVQSVSEVLNGDGVELESTDYILLPKNLSAYHTIRLKNDTEGFTFPDGDDSFIEVTAIFGQFASTPNDIKQACIRLTAFYYRQKDNNSDLDRAINTGDFVIMPTTIPNDVKTIIGGYRSFI
jgi:hypothetical protein